MKRIPVLILVLFVGVLGVIFSGAGTAEAQGGGVAPNQDTYTSRNNPTANLDGQTLLISYDNFPTFVPSDFSYLQFDLSGISTGVNYSTLDLTIVTNGSSAEEVTIGLYSVLDDGWDASSMTHNTAPPAGSLLQTMTVQGDFSGVIQFGDSNNVHPLGTFMEAERTGDGLASLMLRLESVTNPTFFQGSLSMEDVEGTFDGTNGNEPELTPAESPTAITLSQMNGSAVLPSPLYLLVPFLLLGLLTLFAIRRQR